ncbi:GlcG/HbpS family heme-binding protein [Vibrio algarum]|uniref:Heme-binding protein n=1 Tax=Vibrio algarum TaxID=3020714 RepID=A0ABT4YRM4_9VIBR|nr:heme-binding protein [Vibrio sp. KJ40-1]MDB1124207.1 heme-binding protein [Vibrio sp. KJ40-1]
MADYYVKHLAVALPLRDATAIIDKAIEVGHKQNLLPLTVAILDVGGNLIALKREDGCGVMRADIAIGKAWGALGMGISSRTIRDRLADRPSFQAALANVSQGRFVPVPGGVLICNANSEVIGAIGISGDASDKDEYCAITAVNTIGYQSHPEEPNEKWADAGL